MADVQAHLGGIPLDRIFIHPPIGTGTDEDVVHAKSRLNWICELVDGILVGKTMGFAKSLLTTEITFRLVDFEHQHDLGIVLGPGGPLRILPNQIRIPDASFICWDKFPDRLLPADEIFAVAPDLAVEVIWDGNTEAEMQKKLTDYFAAGVRLVWYIDPPTRTAKAYTAPDRFVTVAQNESLSGGDVLPGLELPLSDVFAGADKFETV